MEWNKLNIVGVVVVAAAVFFTRSIHFAVFSTCNVHWPFGCLGWKESGVLNG